MKDNRPYSTKLSYCVVTKGLHLLLILLNYLTHVGIETKSNALVEDALRSVYTERDRCVVREGIV